MNRQWGLITSSKITSSKIIKLSKKLLITLLKGPYGILACYNGVPSLATKSCEGFGWPRLGQVRNIVTIVFFDEVTAISYIFLKNTFFCRNDLMPLLTMCYLMKLPPVKTIMC